MAMAKVEVLDHDNKGFLAGQYSVFLEDDHALVIIFQNHKETRRGRLPLQAVSQQEIELTDDYGEVWARGKVATNPFDEWEKVDKEFWAARPVSPDLLEEVKKHNATPWVQSKEWCEEVDHNFEGDGMRGSRTEVSGGWCSVWVAPDGTKTYRPRRYAGDEHFALYSAEWRALKEIYAQEAESQWLSRWEAEIEWESPEISVPVETPWSRIEAVCDQFRHHKYVEDGKKMMLTVKAVPSSGCGDQPGWLIAAYQSSSGWKRQKPVRVFAHIEVFDMVFFEDEEYEAKTLRRLRQAWERAVASLRPLSSGKPRPVKR